MICDHVVKFAILIDDSEIFLLMVVDQMQGVVSDGHVIV